MPKKNKKKKIRSFLVLNMLLGRKGEPMKDRRLRRPKDARRKKAELEE